MSCTAEKTTIQAERPNERSQCASLPVPILVQVRPHTWYSALPPVTL